MQSFRCLSSIQYVVDGILGLHVDDFLGCGEEVHSVEDATGIREKTDIEAAGGCFKKRLQQLAHKFRFGSWDFGRNSQILFCGTALEQSIGCDSVTLSLKDYVLKVKPITLDKSRKTMSDAPLEPKEVKMLRALIGALAWPAGQCLPQLSASISLLQASSSNPTVNDIVQANKLLRFAKDVVQGYSMTLRRHGRDLSEMRFGVYMDASWGIRPDGSSQGGHTIFIGTDEEINGGQPFPLTIVSWHSRKLNRMCRSSLSAEAQAAASAIDEVEWMKVFAAGLVCPYISIADEDVLHVFGATPALTDAKSLFDSARSVSAGLRLAEKRTAIEVAIVKERLSAMLGYMKWVNSSQQVADGLTKPGAKDNFAHVLKRGVHALKFDPSFTAAKKVTKDAKAGEEQAHEEAAKMLFQGDIFEACEVEAGICQMPGCGKALKGQQSEHRYCSRRHFYKHVNQHTKGSDVWKKAAQIAVLTLATQGVEQAGVEAASIEQQTGIDYVLLLTLLVIFLFSFIGMQTVAYKVYQWTMSKLSTLFPDKVTVNEHLFEGDEVVENESIPSHGAAEENEIAQNDQVSDAGSSSVNDDPDVTHDEWRRWYQIKESVENERSQREWKRTLQDVVKNYSNHMIDGNLRGEIIREDWTDSRCKAYKQLLDIEDTTHCTPDQIRLWNRLCNSRLLFMVEGGAKVKEQKEKWVNSSQQVADGLTKPGAKDNFAHVLKRGVHALKFDPSFTAAKKVTKDAKAGEEQAHEEAAKMLFQGDIFEACEVEAGICQMPGCGKALKGQQSEHRYCSRRHFYKHVNQHTKGSDVWKKAAQIAVLTLATQGVEQAGVEAASIEQQTGIDYVLLLTLLVIFLFSFIGMQTVAYKVYQWTMSKLSTLFPDKVTVNEHLFEGDEVVENESIPSHGAAEENEIAQNDQVSDAGSSSVNDDPDVTHDEWRRWYQIKESVENERSQREWKRTLQDVVKNYSNHMIDGNLRGEIIREDWTDSRCKAYKQLLDIEDTTHCTPDQIRLWNRLCNSRLLFMVEGGAKVKEQKEKWVNSSQQVADGLTKPGAKDNFAHVLKRGVHALKFDPSFTAAKKVTKDAKAGEEQAHEEAAKMLFQGDIFEACEVEAGICQMPGCGKALKGQQSEHCYCSRRHFYKHVNQHTKGSDVWKKAAQIAVLTLATQGVEQAGVEAASIEQQTGIDYVLLLTLLVIFLFSFIGMQTVAYKVYQWTMSKLSTLFPDKVTVNEHLFEGDEVVENESIPSHGAAEENEIAQNDQVSDAGSSSVNDDPDVTHDEWRRWYQIKESVENERSQREWKRTLQDVVKNYSNHMIDGNLRGEIIREDWTDSRCKAYKQLLDIEDTTHCTPDQIRLWNRLCNSRLLFMVEGGAKVKEQKEKILQLERTLVQKERNERLEGLARFRQRVSDWEVKDKVCQTPCTFDPDRNRFVSLPPRSHGSYEFQSDFYER